MKQMIRSQSDNFARLNSQFRKKTQLLYPSPQKRNIQLECKLKSHNNAQEKPLSPDSSSKLSSLNSLEDFESKSPLKVTKSYSNIEKNCVSFHRKVGDFELSSEELRNLRSLNPHEKNFSEFLGVRSAEAGGKAKINEAQEEEDEDEKRQKLCDFDRFLTDMDDK